MKKCIILLAFITFSLGCIKSGDDRGRWIEFIDYGYQWKFFVVNATDVKVLTIANDYPYGPYPHLVNLGPGEDELITGTGTMGGKSEKVLEDEYEDDFRF